MNFIDNTIALRIIYILVKPIESTDAFKLGLIDKDGNTIRKARTYQERNSTSMLHRLCWRIKRVFSLVPGGKTRLGSLAGAYLLVREALDKEMSMESATELFESNVDREFLELGGSVESLTEFSSTVYGIIGQMLTEDGTAPAVSSGPGTTTAALGGTIDLPLFGKPIKRKKS